MFYDRAYASWLPVLRDAVSPDGRRFAFSKLKGNAYANTGSTVYVEDLANGTTRAIYDGSTPFGVVDFESEGVYMTGAVPEGAPRGLWLQDLTGGQPRLISGGIIAPMVGGGSAWGIDFNPADPSPSPGGLEGPRNRLLRFDLRTGSTAPWFYRPGANIWMLGVTADGLPLVTADIHDPAGNDSLELWLVRSSGNAVKLLTDSGGLSSPSALEAVDRYGTWLDSPEGGMIWLYTGGALQVVAKVRAKVSVTVAGGCIP